MTDRELMQQALDALDSKHDMTKAEWRVLQYHAFTALRARLAQPEQEKTRSQKMRDAGITRRPKGWDKDGDETEQEPVAWRLEFDDGHTEITSREVPNWKR